MAENNMYQIYDNEAKITSGAIFTARRDEAAARNFYDLLGSGQDINPCHHPEHFQLLCVGIQDDETAIINSDPHQFPRVITTGAAWQRRNLVNAQLSSSETQRLRNNGTERPTLPEGEPFDSRLGSLKLTDSTP